MAASCLYEDLPADELRLSCLRTAPASVSSLLRRVSAFPARSVIQDILWICYASEKGTGFIKISTAMSVQYICKYSYIIRYISLHLQGLSFFFFFFFFNYRILQNESITTELHVILPHPHHIFAYFQISRKTKLMFRNWVSKHFIPSFFFFTSDYMIHNRL